MREKKWVRTRLCALRATVPEDGQTGWGWRELQGSPHNFHPSFTLPGPPGRAQRWEGPTPHPACLSLAYPEGLP